MIDESRVGTFSSSSNYKLIPMGKVEMTEEELAEYKRLNPKSKARMKASGYADAGKTYIWEKQHELLTGRQITKEVDSKATNWGLAMEQRVFDNRKLLSMDYTLETHRRYVHPETPFWTGSPDLVSEDLVADIKAPYSLTSFCRGVDTFGDLDAFKEEKPDYYWQLISNAILVELNLKKKIRFAESVIYCPYKSELKEIREELGENPKYAFISFLEDDQLPYLIEGKHYKNINKFRFEIPQEDKEFLTERVFKAIEELKK